MKKGISETAFSSQVEDLLTRFGWRWLHLKPARTGKGAWVTRTNKEGKGFPDYLGVRPPRLIFAELKSEKGKTTPEQEAWLEDLRECGKMITFTPIEKGKLPSGEAELSLVPSLEVYLWRPGQFDEIMEILR